MARGMLQMHRFLSKISVSVYFIETRQDTTSLDSTIKTLKQKYDSLADLMIEEKKLKEEIFMKA